MKVGSGELDLGFFIDRTIKQCLEYDLITSDTDAVLEDMAKAWPAKQDTVCPPCATGVRRDLSSGSKEDVRRFNSNSISNNIKADRTASPETSLSLTSKQSHQLSVDDLKMGDPGLPNHRDSPVENLSMSTRSRGVEDHTSLVEGNRESPVGQVAGEGRRGSLRKSHSCEELMSLGGQGRSDHDGCQASSSPEMTSVGSSSRVSSSPEMTTVASSSRPAKLKSRLQLRYQEDGGFSEIMEDNSTGNFTNGGRTSRDTVRESPVRSSPPHQGAPSSAPRRSENDRKRPGTGSLEGDDACAKRVRREDSADPSRLGHQYPELQFVRRLSPEKIAPPPLRPDFVLLRAENARYQTAARLSSNEGVLPGVHHPGILPQGLDMVKVPGGMRNPQSLAPPPQLSGFLPTPRQMNGFRPIGEKEFSSSEVRHLASHGQQYHQPHSGNQQQQQRQQQPRKCTCGGCGNQLRQGHRQHHEYLQQKQHQHQDRASIREIHNSKNQSSLKNPMFRISSIIAEELQRDDENDSSENPKIYRREDPDSKTWTRRCTHARCTRSHYLNNVQTPSPPSADLAARRESAQQHPTHSNGYIPRGVVVPRLEESGVSNLPRQYHNRFGQHPQEEIHRDSRELRSRRPSGSAQHQGLSPEISGCSMPGAVRHHAARGSPPGLPRAHPSVRGASSPQTSAQHHRPSRDANEYLARSEAQTPRDVPGLVRHSPPGCFPSRVPGPHLPPAMNSSEAPPPSHQAPLSDAHAATPLHNILLPSHHPLSHLSPTRVPVYNGRTPDQDQPQDLSYKGRSVDITSVTTKSFSKLLQDSSQNGYTSSANSLRHKTGEANPRVKTEPEVAGDIRTINPAMSADRVSPSSFHKLSPYIAASPGNLGPAVLAESQPLNLTVTDRLKRGFYSTPSSPEIRGQVKTSGRGTGLRCAPGSNTP